jgi:Ca2+-binding RTX toxin-like protein
MGGAGSFSQLKSPTVLEFTGMAGCFARTLTTSIDTFQGTSGDDIFNGGANSGNQTFTSGDILDGGAGNDTLSLEIAGGSTYQATKLANIEAVSVAFTSAGTLSLLGSTGIKTVNAYGDAANATFTNINSSAIALGFSNTTQTATFGYIPSVVAGTVDSATLTLSNVQQTSGGGESITVNGIETLNIISSGVDNTVDDLATNVATKLVVSGDQPLTIYQTLDTLIAAVDASAATAAVTVTLPAVATATVSGGAGADSLTVSAVTGDFSIDTGAGNDTIVTGANLTITDTVIGGAGVDTLSTDYATANGYVTPTTLTISGIETLLLTDAATGSVTTRNLDTGINKIILAVNDDTNAAATFNFNAGASTLQIGLSTTAAALSNNGTATTVTVDAYGSATDDSLIITNSNLSTADAYDDVAVTSTDFETVTINTGSYSTAIDQTIGAITVTGSTGATSAETVKFTGANKITVSGTITADIIDASGLTGGAARGLVLSTAATTVSSITGGAGNDTLLGDASTNIDGGAGADSIVGGTGADTLTGGAGNDSITGAGGNDLINAGADDDTVTVTVAGNVSIDGGTGIDTFDLGATLNASDTINGGDGTDTLILTDAGIQAVNNLSITDVNTLTTNLSNIEKLSLASLATAIDVGRLDGVSTLTLAAKGANDITGLAATNSITLTSANTAAFGLGLGNATGSSDVINLTLNASGSIDSSTGGAISVTSVEQVNVTANDSDTTATNATADAADTLTLTDATSTDVLNTVVVAGNALSLNLALTGSTAISNLDGSAFKGALTATLVSTVAATVTGGVGADVLTGGTKADAINGGTGNDTINGGLGSDTLDGGTGTNTLDAAASLTLGTSTDSDGNVAITGVVVNLGTTAISGATINTALSGSYISGALSSIAVNTSAYLFASASNLASVTVDTLTNFTKVIGSAGPDYIVGGAAAESLTGAAGSDNINGGSGNDTISGGAGMDTISGGAGEDAISFGNVLVSGDTAGDADDLAGSLEVDTITFVTADDTLLISQTIFGTMGNGASGVGSTLAANQFHSQAGTSTITNTSFDVTGNGAFIYDTTGNDLYFVQASASITSGSTLLSGLVSAGTAVKIADITLTGTITAADFSIIA